MNERLCDILTKLSPEALIGIMWEAVSDMQHYNGQSQNTVIARAMGGLVSQVDHSFTVPSVETAEKEGIDSPLF